MSTKSSSTLESTEFRFNNGYHDGAKELLAGQPRCMRGHHDRVYARGYTAGQQAYATGEYLEDNAWARGVR